MSKNRAENDFQMNDEKQKHIAKTFNVTEVTVAKLYEDYKKIKSLMEGQYLAHVMRSLESLIREEQGWALFRITCKPSIGVTKTGLASASYQPKQYFNIVYDNRLDQIQKRVAIAHELGHLFLMFGFEKTQTDTHEPLSSILGIFTMFDKNSFYCKEHDDLCHDTWQDVVKDFSLLKNRKNEIFNLS